MTLGVDNPDDLIRFWFGERDTPPLGNSERWWEKSDGFDHLVRERFEGTLERGARGELPTWGDSPHGRLALVLLFDQLPRNMFRGTPRSFEYDERARAAATRAIQLGDMDVLTPLETSFLLMPFMHAENTELQKRSCTDFAALCEKETDPDLHAYLANCLKFARMHASIIQRFGHFPHRNTILGRPTTQAEATFLKQPGSSF